MKDINKHEILELLQNDKEEKINYIQYNAIQRLEATLETAKLLDNKAYILFSVFFYSLIFLIGIFFTNYEFVKTLKEQKMLLLLPIPIQILFFLILIGVILFNIMPKQYIPKGKEPRKLLKQEILNLSLKSIIYLELLNIENAINQNFETNNKKAKNIKFVLTVLYINILISIIIAIFWIF